MGGLSEQGEPNLLQGTVREGALPTPTPLTTCPHPPGPESVLPHRGWAPPPDHLGLGTESRVQGQSQSHTWACCLQDLLSEPQPLTTETR